MSNEKTPFTETIYYPILFMVIVSLIFVGVLAVMFRTSEAKINANQENAYRLLIVKLTAKTIADATNSQASALIGNPSETFTKYIKEDKAQSRKCFIVSANDKPLAFCYDIGGNGLWGSMRALVALAPDKSTILDFAIYDQMETPGLGGRIEEDFFRTQFSGKKLIENGSPASFTLVPERQAQIKANEVRQITGATITSNSVLKMLKDEMGIINNLKGETK